MFLKIDFLIVLSHQIAFAVLSGFTLGVEVLIVATEVSLMICRKDDNTIRVEFVVIF